MKTAELFLTAFLCILSLVAGAAGEPTNDFLQEAAQLERVQARIAQGDKSAIVSQSKILAAISAAILKTRAADWNDQRHIHVAVQYLLAGGEPKVVEQIFRKQLIFNDESLLVGTLAYVVGREKDARDRLSTIDPRSLPKSVGAQTAFMKSVLSTAGESGTAVELLDLARLLAPGGLLEEAALRREFVLLAQPGHAEKALRLLRQYLSRFGNSLFAEKFLTEVIAAVPRLEVVKSANDIGVLEFFASSISRDQKRTLYLVVARDALLNGRMPVAEAAASRALAFAAETGPDREVARLYIAAARLTGRDSQSAVADLSRIDTSKLSAIDGALLAAAKEVASRLHSVSDLNLAQSSTPDAVKPSVQELVATESLKRGKASLARAEQMLGR